MEVGPRDLAAQTVVLVRRDTGAKTPVPWADIATAVPQLLATIQVGRQSVRSITSHALLPAGGLQTPSVFPLYKIVQHQVSGSGQTSEC